jgi:hypothetical protein
MQPSLRERVRNPFNWECHCAPDRRAESSSYATSRSFSSARWTDSEARRVERRRRPADTSQRDTCSRLERDVELTCGNGLSITASDRRANSSAPSSLGCSGGHSEVVVRMTKAARTVGTFGWALERTGGLWPVRTCCAGISRRGCDVGALLVWMNDQDVAARLARHRLTDALTE